MHVKGHAVHVGRIGPRLVTALPDKRTMAGKV